MRPDRDVIGRALALAKNKSEPFREALEAVLLILKSDQDRVAKEFNRLSGEELAALALMGFDRVIVDTVHPLGTVHLAKRGLPLLSCCGLARTNWQGLPLGEEPIKCESCMQAIRRLLKKRKPRPPRSRKTG